MRKNLEWLNEYTYKDLLKGASPDKKRLAKERNAFYNGLFANEMRFTSPGTEKWQQKIRLLDLETALKLKGMTLLDRVKLAVSGDLEVYCSCPSWTFHGFAYIASQLGYGFKEDPEHRFPKVRNPQLAGTTCKHLITVLQVLAFHSGSLAKNIKTSPKYKQYVNVQESYKNEFYPVNEEKFPVYDKLGDFRYMSVSHLVSNLSNPTIFQEDVINKDNFVVVSESASGKYLLISGSNVIKNAHGVYDNVPVILLK